MFPSDRGRPTIRTGGGRPADLSVRLPPELTAPRAARRWVGRLAGILDDELLDSVRLLVSELVTNSVRHAEVAARERDAIELSIRVDDTMVSVQVADPGWGFEPPAPPPLPDRASGWGLYLVDGIADRWGVRGGDRTVVWFELGLERPKDRP